MIKTMGINWFYHRLLHSIKLKTKYYNYIEKKYSDISNIIDMSNSFKKFEELTMSKKISKKELSKLSSDKKQKIINKANRIINNEFTYYYHDEFKFEKVNWHYNPYKQKTHDKHLKWYNLPMHSYEYGDIKDYWELSRFVYVYDLIHAYKLTDDSRYPLKFIELTNDWMINNPFEYGVNYKCSQETSIRCINWIMGILHLDILRDYPDETEKLFMSILQQAYHVKELMSYSVNCVKNNHTLNEAMFLYIVGCTMSFKESNDFYLHGKNIYNNSISNQIMTDGSYIQNSLTYHRMMLLSTVVFKYFEERNNDLDSNSTKLIKQAIIFLNSFVMESGDVPNYGSNDGSIPFNFYDSEYRDFKSVIDLTTRIFMNQEYYNENPIYINAWFKKSIKFKAEDSELLPKKNRSIFYEQGGYLKFNEGHKNLFMRINNGKRRPGQADNNSIDFWNSTSNIINDTGTYKYSEKSNVLNYFRGAPGHNYLRVNGLESMKRISNFMYLNWSSSEIVKLDLDNNYIEILNNDYKSYEITRTVNLKDTLKVHDIIKPTKNESYYVEFYFHFISLPILTHNGSHMKKFDIKNHGTIEFSSNTNIEVQIDYGSRTPFLGWKSLYYNKLEKNYLMTIKIKSNEKIDLVTVYNTH